MTTLFDLPTEAPAALAAAGPRPTVIGLDIALVLSGVAGTGWTDLIRTGDRRAEERLVYLVEAAASFYRRADFVVIEGAAYSTAKQVGHDELSAARWAIRCDLWRRGIPCAVVNPDSRTIYATGRARHKHPETGRKLTAAEVKGLVRDAVCERYGVPCEGRGRYDQADAYVLHAMGLHWLGYPLADVPPSHSRALDGVQWPGTPAVAR
ncbi:MULTISPECIES: hypothetical protein [Streptomyces]|uniref:hypothetical protein n=1 Tax=Streptomyces TaxID=1883 RepID=UPI0019AE197A|nr:MULTISPECIES: hypothetical protein [Streptomyces]GGR70828.1 hypothetical protein GCM10010236_26320 [Streptomyces eurythermus]